VLERYRDMLAVSEAERPKRLSALPTGVITQTEPPSADVDGVPQAVEFLGARMIGPDGTPSETFNHGEPLELRVRLRGVGELPTLRFVLDLFSEDFGLRITNTGTEHLSAETGDLAIFPLFDLRGEQELTVRLPRNPLGSGTYSWTLSVLPFDADVETPAGRGAEYLRRSRLSPFRSVSFPGHALGRLRRIVVEPEVELSLEPAKERPLWSVREGANR
jgi:hypothetical protein